MVPPDSQTFLSRRGVRLGYQRLGTSEQFMAPRTDTAGMLTLRPAQAADEAAVVALWQACELVVSHNVSADGLRPARGQSNSEVLISVVPPELCVRPVSGG